MNITISDTRSVADIQEEFARNFPFLRLEFFSRPHKAGKPSPRSQMLKARTLGECRTAHSSGDLQITPAMTVAALEQEFLSHYGLSVQVFRKSGKVWLETTITDGWTLAEQNAQGEALSVSRKWDE
ncbi:MAG: hypothetical protein MUC87_17345 [Bacteroidia bacterium]|jgi:hypothetical protein|nr:hypothetical protein [Bacteroidia bacterium]